MVHCVCALLSLLDKRQPRKKSVNRDASRDKMVGEKQCSVVRDVSEGTNFING